MRRLPRSSALILLLTRLRTGCWAFFPGLRLRELQFIIIFWENTGRQMRCCPKISMYVCFSLRSPELKQKLTPNPGSPIGHATTPGLHYGARDEDGLSAEATIGLCITIQLLLMYSTGAMGAPFLFSCFLLPVSPEIDLSAAGIIQSAFPACLRLLSSSSCALLQSRYLFDDQVTLNSSFSIPSPKLLQLRHFPGLQTRQTRSNY